jgi:hypothetical protein
MGRYDMCGSRLKTMAAASKSRVSSAVMMALEHQTGVFGKVPFAISTLPKLQTE